jgi:Asp/Glu/hydantoin racemase
MNTINSMPLRILVINPNTSTSMTDSFRPVLETLPLTTSLRFTYWTCPTGPTIIKTVADMHESVLHSLPLLLKLAPHFDGFLAACYADHPLVRLLQAQIQHKPVVGIFDASIYAALQLISEGSKFAILTTGKPYEALLAHGVTALLKYDPGLQRFAGVVASGIGLSDASNPVVAKHKITTATTQLLQRHDGDVDVICMGGAILVGMEDMVHEACELVLGAAESSKIKVVDQLAAGMLTLEALLLGRLLNEVDYHMSLR